MVNNNLYTKKSNRILNPLEKYRKKQKEKEKQKIILRRKEKREKELKDNQDQQQKSSLQQYDGTQKIIAVDLDKLEQEEMQQDIKQNIDKDQKNKIRGPPEHPVPFYILNRIKDNQSNQIHKNIDHNRQIVNKNYKNRRMNYVDQQKNDPFYKLTTNDQYDIRVNQQQQIIQNQISSQQMVNQQQTVNQQQQQLSQNKPIESQTNIENDLKIPKDIKSDFESLFHLKQSMDQEEQYIKNKVIINKKAEIIGKSQLDVSIRNQMFIPSNILKQKQNKNDLDKH